MKIAIYTVWPVKFWQCPESQAARLKALHPEFSFVHATNVAQGLAALADADIAFSSGFSPAMLAQAKKLRWVHSTAAATLGLLPLKDLAERDIVVTNSSGLQSAAIAEHVMGGLLMLARRFDLTLEAQRDRRWIQNDIDVSMWPRALNGRRMTIVGLGSIGIEVARRAHAFGMPVTGVRRRADQPKPEFVERVFDSSRLDESLNGCDVLVLCAPFLPTTDRLIGPAHFALLNPGAVVVNVARGQILDEQALISNLTSGRLGGAVLDVFDREPLDTSSPLWTLPNVVITPHCSGYRPDHWDDVINLFSENLRRFQRGEELLNIVDCAVGY
jgi:phosphoglycerate dehydrogenase-like enzyme